jgi:hypothetical protein
MKKLQYIHLIGIQEEKILDEIITDKMIIDTK